MWTANKEAIAQGMRDKALRRKRGYEFEPIPGKCKRCSGPTLPGKFLCPTCLHESREVANVNWKMKLRADTQRRLNPPDPEWERWKNLDYIHNALCGPRGNLSSSWSLWSHASIGNLESLVSRNRA